MLDRIQHGDVEQVVDERSRTRTPRSHADTCRTDVLHDLTHGEEVGGESERGDRCEFGIETFPDHRIGEGITLAGQRLLAAGPQYRIGRRGLFREVFRTAMRFEWSIPCSASGIHGYSIAHDHVEFGQMDLAESDVSLRIEYTTSSKCIRRVDQPGCSTMACGGMHITTNRISDLLGDLPHLFG